MDDKNLEKVIKDSIKQRRQKVFDSTNEGVDRAIEQINDLITEKINEISITGDGIEPEIYSDVFGSCYWSSIYSADYKEDELKIEVYKPEIIPNVVCTAQIKAKYVKCGGIDGYTTCPSMFGGRHGHYYHYFSGGTADYLKKFAYRMRELSLLEGMWNNEDSKTKKQYGDELKKMESSLRNFLENCRFPSIDLENIDSQSHRKAMAIIKKYKHLKKY